MAAAGNGAAQRPVTALGDGAEQGLELGPVDGQRPSAGRPEGGDHVRDEGGLDGHGIDPLVMVAALEWFRQCSRSCLGIGTRRAVVVG